jgi:hypothetical protein
MEPVSENLAGGRALAPLMIGVTGKLQLGHADEAVRTALDRAFDRIDERCPLTPKILLSALASGADSLAALAAKDRPGWRVVAPMPLNVELYSEDFERADREMFDRLRRDPKVRVITLDRLRRGDGASVVFDDEDLSRRTKTSSDPRDFHYEQVGLYIAERSAILIAVMKIGEAPDQTGGTARIVHHRLHGEMDAKAAAIRRRSTELLAPPPLDDRHAGPVWVVDLARLSSAPKASEEALRVRLPDEEVSLPIHDRHAMRRSFELADGVEALNRKIEGLDTADWAAIEHRAGPHLGDAGSHLRRLRLELSTIQGELTHRVRVSVVLFAVLFFITILLFELYVGLASGGMAGLVSAGFYAILFVLGFLIYRHAARASWQRLAEDYRAASEALRVQLVWWSCGLGTRDDRVGRYYLLGAQGAFRQLRILIDHLIDGALVCFGPSASAPDDHAVDAWARGQVDFFSQRIKSRRWLLILLQGASWFLVAVSLAVAICLPLMQLADIGSLLMTLRVSCHVAIRWAVGLVALGVFAGLLATAVRKRWLAAKRNENLVLTNPTSFDWVGGITAGVILTLALCDFSTIFAHEPVVGAIQTQCAKQCPIAAREALSETFRWAKELVAMAVILPISIAGAIRYVAEKLSWEAELSGYEHARERFRRGLDVLAEVRASAPEASEDYRGIVRAMGAEALSENENWLRAHRERPLEPLVG